ncbi:MAG TPA: zinc ribbon domain-containing protein [Pyrinomonadaceae bacterium]|nr:zinc ribbon domain-containing protein [Pyrinomonadaceae bacterium]
MFCPKCATQNLDGAKFCRSCGANVSLVPQALSGQLAQASADDGDLDSCSVGRRRRGPVGLDQAFRNVFMGIAFLLVALALAFSRMGGGWWFWMLIPAFSMMGTGVAQYIRLKEREKRAFQPGNFGQPSFQASLNPQAPVGAFPARNTGEMVAPPPSVTEGTTRHLGAEAPTTHFRAPSEVPK